MEGLHYMNEVFNEAGFLHHPEDWSEPMMHEIAKREGIDLTDEMIMYIKSCRSIYERTQTVPPLREFSKIHGGDRKGTRLNEVFNGGPMKKIAMLGGLPQPTGCV
jgi:tRNA 2-thiouridine synthesizing protein E